MPLEIERGERIVGRPRLRDADEFDQDRLAEAQRVLTTMPPFPGGDNGHLHPDIEKLFRIGLAGILAEIDARGESAREETERYPDLLVRVAGYSDYFVKLSLTMQAEFIARTEHAL